MPPCVGPRDATRDGQRTHGQLTFEVTLRFKVRAAGHPSNDSSMFNSAHHMLVDLLKLLKFVQRGDESAEIAAVRWRRPGETWQHNWKYEP